MKRKQRSDAESFGLILNSEWYAPSEMISPPRHGQQTLRGIRWKRAYGGQIVHKGKAFPGEHAAIVDEDLWRRVQSHLEENRMERREGEKVLEPSLLAGIVFDACSESMTLTHAVKERTQYRYYISRHLIIGRALDSSQRQRVPAANPGALVIGRLRALLTDPVQFVNAISNGERDAPMQKSLRDAAAGLSFRWEHPRTETLRDFTRRGSRQDSSSH